MVKAHLESFMKICTGAKDGGKLAALDQTERFRWLTANRSTVIQFSPVHPGLCEDPAPLTYHHLLLLYIFSQKIQDEAFSTC